MVTTLPLIGVALVALIPVCWYLIAPWREIEDVLPAETPLWDGGAASGEDAPGEDDTSVPGCAIYERLIDTIVAVQRMRAAGTPTGPLLFPLTEDEYCHLMRWADAALADGAAYMSTFLGLPMGFPDAGDLFAYIDLAAVWRYE